MFKTEPMLSSTKARMLLQAYGIALPEGGKWYESGTALSIILGYI